MKTRASVFKLTWEDGFKSVPRLQCYGWRSPLGFALIPGMCGNETEASKGLDKEKATSFAVEDSRIICRDGCHACLKNMEKAIFQRRHVAGPTKLVTHSLLWRRLLFHSTAIPLVG